MPENSPPAAVPPATAEDLIAPPPCLRIERVEVWKSSHTLHAYCKAGAVVVMSVAIGREEVGPKTRFGDRRTPEGRYRISGPARPGRFHLFVPIDYPSREDAQVALAQKRISSSDYQRIAKAHESGAPPPSDTALGGQLGFHGEGPRWRGDSRDLDWTYGCIAVTDAEIEFLSQRVGPGVPVWIHP